MSTRQYIGARYVPKFFDWDGSAEWRSGVAYEALTIVTRNGNSYTSKIPVPSNIGAPESNPTYWVATGLYNEQIESIREAILAAQGDIDTLDGRMDTAEGDINTLETDVTNLSGRVTTAEGDIDTLEGKMTTAEGDIDSLEGRMTTAEGDIDSLEGRVTTAEGDIDSLEGRMTTAEGDIDSLEGRMTTAEGDIDSLEGRVGVNETDILGLKNTRALNLHSRKFLFLGDSYIGSHDHTCVELACAWLGITNYENISVSGSSFHQGTFLAQLQNYSGNKNAVTDIWLIGGLNDCIGTSVSTELRTAIDNFFTYQKANYPNAHVYVCFVGHALDNAAQLGGRNWATRTWTRWMYQEMISVNGGTFYDDMWQALVPNVSLMGDDKIHPSADGQFEMARFLVNYLTNGKISGNYPYYQLGTMSQTYYTIADNFLTIWSGGQEIDVGGQTIGGNDLVPIYSGMPMYFNKPVYYPTFARAYQANSITHQEVRGWLVASGQSLSLRLNCLDNSGFKNFVFASNGNITIEQLQMHIPMLALL